MALGKLFILSLFPLKPSILKSAFVELDKKFIELV